MLMKNNLTDVEALTVCDGIRDDIMRQQGSLYERLRKADALAQVMNLAQAEIERRRKNSK